MRIIFCADPLHPGQPDSVYASEAAAVEVLGLCADLIDLEALLQGNATAAVQQIEAQKHSVFGLYRGWMLNPHHYDQLFEALAVRGIILLNDAAAYEHCHLLP